jgi:hypothetical protein
MAYASDHCYRLAGSFPQLPANIAARAVFLAVDSI